MNENEIKIVGCTPVTKGLTVVYYISSQDDSGREDQWGHTKSERKIRKAFEKAKETEYDMHLYRSLVKGYYGANMELIDDEVIDSYNED